MKIEVPPNPPECLTQEIDVAFKGESPGEQKYGRDVCWSIRQDACELVSFLRRKEGFSRRKAFIIFCSIAWQAVRTDKYP